MSKESQPSNSLIEWYEHYKVIAPNNLNNSISKSINFVIAYDQTTDDNDTIIDQSLTMVKKGQQCHMHPDILAALLIFPPLRELQTQTDHKLPVEKISRPILELVKKALKIDIIDQLSQSKDTSFIIKHNQNLRRMLLAIVEDPRAVPVKLIECLCSLHKLKNAGQKEKKQYATHVQHIYAPLANRLGLAQIKWELEDIAFRYLQPTDYFTISKSLKLKRKEREKIIHSIHDDLKALLQKNDIHDAEISGRAKHIYSIAKKMKRKRADFSQIFDTAALRILVPTINDCYNTLSTIHSHWSNIPEEFDDYITNPKPNGYRSLHTAITSKEHGCVEIQIRTFDMHKESEMGIAAHWKYKEQPHKSDQHMDKVNLLRQVIDWQKTMSGEANNEQFNAIVNERIYVFTPEGDIHDLAKNSTPLDFAYKIHTQVGHRCRGAKVNQKLVNLTHKLKTGDKVDIMTSKIDRPSRDWLNLKLGYLTTSHAINKVKYFFRKQNYQDNLARGQGIWEKAYRQHKLDRNQLPSLATRFNLISIQDLLAALGAGDIQIGAILAQYNSHLSPSTDAPLEAVIKNKNKTSTDTQFYIEGTTGILTKTAKCCHPIPGDEITGYITKGAGICIHKKTCPNIMSQSTLNSDRLIKADWRDLSQLFVVNLLIEGIDRKGLVNDITNLILNHDCKLCRLSTRVNDIQSTAYIIIELQTKNLDQFKKLTTALNNLKGIIKVERK